MVNFAFIHIYISGMQILGRGAPVVWGGNFPCAPPPLDETLHMVPKVTIITGYPGRAAHARSGVKWSGMSVSIIIMSCAM